MSVNKKEAGFCSIGDEPVSFSFSIDKKNVDAPGAGVRVLGIDPGFAHTGFGVVECSINKFRLVGYGEIVTSPSDDTSQRLYKIFYSLYNLIHEYKPLIVGIEELFFAKNASSAMVVSQAKGVIECVVGAFKLPLFHYTPNEIKKAVTGSSRSDKISVQQGVKILLGLQFVPEPDHAADALAAAITCYNNTRLL